MALTYWCALVTLLHATWAPVSFSQPIPYRDYSMQRRTWSPPTNAELGQLMPSLLHANTSVIFPTQDAYEKARRPWQTFYQCNAYPTVVVRPGIAADVVRTMTYSTQNNLHVTVRNGGHSYAGISRSYGLVLDVSRMNTIEKPVVQDDGDSLVKVGAGQINIGVYCRLAEFGLALPAGGCPSVGISGLTLGGGFGVLSRKLGLTSDRVTELEAVVFKDNKYQSVTVNKDQYSDLFFAFRGGMGGNYGVVTSWTYKAIRIDQVYTNTYKLRLDIARAQGAPGDRQPYINMIRIIEVFMQWCDGTINEIYCEMSMSSTNLNATTITLPEAEAAQAQRANEFELDVICACHVNDTGCAQCKVEDKELLSRITSTGVDPDLYTTSDGKVKQWRAYIWEIAGCKKLYERSDNSCSVDNVQMCANLTQTRIGRGQHNRKKSLFMSSDPDQDLLIALFQWFDDFATNILVDNYTAANIEFYQWGGALAKPPSDVYKSAWTHRNQKWLAHVTGRFRDAADPRTIAVVYHALNVLHSILEKPFATGAQDYQNFADASLSYEAWSNFYFDEGTVKELQKINKKYNPHDIFRNELSIPVSSASPLTVSLKPGRDHGLAAVILISVFAMFAYTTFV